MLRWFMLRIFSFGYVGEATYGARQPVSPFSNCRVHSLHAGRCLHCPHTYRLRRPASKHTGHLFKSRLLARIPQLGIISVPGGRFRIVFRNVKSSWCTRTGGDWYTLSLLKVCQAFPSPNSLTTTRLCRQNKLAPRFLKTASNLSSFSLNQALKSSWSPILMKQGILTEPDLYYKAEQNYVNRTPLTYLCVNCMNQEVIIIL